MRTMRTIFLSKSRILLLLLGLTASLYILFLYYSMNGLDAVNSRSLPNHHKGDDRLMKNEPIQMPKDVLVNRIQLPMQGKNTNTVIRGVPRDRIHLYLPTQNKSFECLYTKEQIPYKRLNDDFCDCKDNSDEPGTSACASSKFYCNFQFDGLHAQFVWSSRVNDGICDCCDGSDEWKGITLPDNIRIKDPSQGGAVIHAPCINRCAAIVQQVRRKKMLIMEGRKLRAAYVAAADKVKDKKVYGPEGVFYKLSLECFRLQLHFYEYNICPFKKCTQQKFPQPTLSLGRKPVWEKMKPGSYVLKMMKGSSQYCPNVKERLTRIYFECGIKDGVRSITEDVCEYNVIFDTPAAC